MSGSNTFDLDGAASAAADPRASLRRPIKGPSQGLFAPPAALFESSRRALPPGGVPRRVAAGGARAAIAALGDRDAPPSSGGGEGSRAPLLRFVHTALDVPSEDRAALLAASAGAEEGIGGAGASGGGAGAPLRGDSSAAALWAEASALRTGDDAVAFFFKHASRATPCPVKFLHLALRYDSHDTSLPFRPYDLVVIPYAEAVKRRDYFTMSSRGILHTTSGGASEFHTLSEWMREASSLAVCAALSFFKLYLPRKMFNDWRANVSFNRFLRQRAATRARLFVWAPTFAAALSEVCTQVAMIERVAVFSAPESRYTAAVLQEEQGTVRLEAAKAWERHVLAIIAATEKVVNDVTRRAASADGGGEGGEGSAGGGGKAKSLAAAKAENERRAAAQRAVVEDATQLGAFVRRVDYMVTEAIARATEAAFAKFLGELREGELRHGLPGFFVTAVRFLPNGTTGFEPSLSEYEQVLDIVVAEAVRTAGSVTRVLHARAFRSHVQPLADASGALHAPSAGDLLLESATLAATCAEAHARFRADFAAAGTYVAAFDVVRPIYAFQQAFNWEAFQRSAAELTSTGALQREMARLRSWDALLERMRTQHVQGSLQVDSKRLKGELEPVTVAGLERLRSLLTETSRTKCRAVSDAFLSRTRLLDTRPISLDKFAAHLERLVALRDAEAALVADLAAVDDMFQLLAAYDVKVSSEDAVALDDMRSGHGAYTDAVRRSDTWLEERMPEMTRQLETAVLRNNDALKSLSDAVGEGVYVDATQAPAAVLELLGAVSGKLHSLAAQSEAYSKWQGLFSGTSAPEAAAGGAGAPPPKANPRVREAVKAVKGREQLWRGLADWDTRHASWMSAPFAELEVEDVARDVMVAVKLSYGFAKALNDDVAALFKSKVSAFRGFMGPVLDLGNKNMRERHWERLYAGQTEFAFVANNAARTLAEVLAHKLHENPDLCAEVSGIASGEAQLEAALAKIESAWAETNFTTKVYREQRGVYILSALDEVVVQLEDHQVTLQTMMGSRFIAGVRDTVEAWDKRLGLLSETLDEWLACQKAWMYLETIFSAEDIQRQLPVEAAKFMTVDRRWKDNMMRTHSRPLVLACVDAGDELLRAFQQSNIVLEAIQKALEAYLETKRAAFPRFYFLSNDELLEILAQTRDPTSVQPHMQKCFDSVKSVTFETGPSPDDPSLECNLIVAMNSAEGEAVTLMTPVPAVGNVEEWLTAFEKEMRTSLRAWSARVMAEYPAPEDAEDRKAWFWAGPAQCILAIDLIQWTHGCTAAIKEAIAAGTDATRTLGEFLAFSRRQLENMVALVRGNLTRLQRTLLGALTVIDVHARDVVAAMVAKAVATLEDFEWTKQLRYYWEEDVIVRQCNTRFASGHEYLGNSERLVITPLTDVCYMTLTGALHLKFGGAPAGPAGTGKTETTKDLAKALAVQCVVFNCSDGLDYKIMGRFFTGLATSGAWSCFDEFNRIDIEVLSVIAQQVLTIQQGLMTGAKLIMFEGREIPLSPSFGVFITMNPGYAGRTELPDNLKSLFRPVAMMVPDYRMIAEIILYSQGFTDAFALSNKMVNLYKLASEQLSKQDHYDFGMRAVKSVLVAAGQLKRKEPDVAEDVLLIRAMRDSNVPKFLEHDLPLFRGIITDLFPGVTVPLVDYGELQKAVEAQMRIAGLQVVPALVEKVIQSHETQLVRHGMMLVGESGSGKTTNHTILSRALKQLFLAGVQDKDGFFKEVWSYVLNPKSISMGELYGEFNLTTQEWRDGLVASLVRDAVADTTPARKWMIFDGPVDAIWIESMNTVLDDNKMLCLTNGERIKLASTMHMIFEVRDLAVASPATVSRCGMVYCEPQHVGNQAIIDTWAEDEIEDLLPEHVATLRARITGHVPQLLAFLRKECTEAIPSQDSNLVASFLNLLLTLLRPENGVRSPGGSLFPRSAATKARERAEASAGGGAAAALSAEGIAALAAEGAAAPAAADGTAPTAAVADSAAPAVAAGEEEGDDLLSMRGGGARKGIMSLDVLTRVVDLAYVFAVTWSFGANLHDASRPRFNAFACELLSELLFKHVSFIPSADGASNPDLFALVLSPEAGAMLPWESRMASFSFSPTTPYFNILVPSVDTTRYSSLFATIIGSCRNVLFAGETGVGKSVIIADAMGRLVAGDTARFVSTGVNFSAQTSSGNLQEALEANLDKKRKNLLGPPAGKKMCVFVDDLNMPAKEKYGAQPPIELLRQVIDQGGFYDRAKLFFKNVADTVFAAACAPPGGGRQEVTTRVTRRFHMVWLPALSAASMSTIFNAILGGFLEFEAPALVASASDVVASSVLLYQRVQAEMLPTPSKSHYTFNLRDLSKVFQGVLQARAAQMPSRDALLRLWLHEEQRVFRDRLIDEPDRDAFNTMCVDVLASNLGSQWAVADFDDLLWGDYTYARGDAEKRYIEVEGAAKASLPSLLANVQEEYNLEGKPMNLTFFAYAIAHVSRVSRILRQPRGNALLVGVGGSGRQSLTRLAAFLAEMKTVSIEITRGYGMNEWHEDLVKVMMLAGAKQKDVVFLFSDTQIVKESMLEDINNILNSGDVPNLYPPDVMEGIISAVRPAAKAAGRPETRAGIFAQYIQQLREHLHIVLAMSPIGSAFRNRCRMFPALVNCCTIDWFSAWPQDALFSVARSFLAVDAGGAPSGSSASLELGELVDPLCKLAVAIHQSVEVSSARYLSEQRRYNYTTPTSYLELLNLYASKLNEQRGIVAAKLARYRNGLTKLSETNVMVVGLQSKLTELQPTLQKASADTATLLVALEKDQKQADAQAAIAAKDEAETAEVAKAVSLIKDDCQKDLDEALPAYYAAMKALKSLDKKQIQEVKSFANPPRMVGFVMEAVCILLGRDPDWDTAKKVLNQVNFMDQLVSYDKDNIDPRIIKKVAKYVKDPDFTTEVVSKVSTAATSLCAFVRAIYKYYEVATTIAPKRAKLAEAEGRLAEAEGKLADKRAALASVMARLAELKAQFNASLSKRDDLNKQSTVTSLRLDRAHKLTGGLGDEAVRWTSAAAQLAADLSNLVGNMLLAAGAIAYLGPFTAQYRGDLTAQWVSRCMLLRIPVDPLFDLVRLQADPTTVRDWNIQGLPSDAFSTENGLFATLGRRWPLMIDPQGQANRWVRAMFRDAKLQVIKLSDPNFLRALENGIRYGFPVLLENVEEELDPSLEPVLLKQYVKKGGQVLLRLGDTDVPVSDAFRFFIATKLPNPHYLPEVCIKVTCINFTVTMSGLTDQLLGLVVSKERPDLESKKDALIVTMAADKRALKDIEDKILSMLAESKGDILDDEALIASLGQSRVTSNTIGERMRESEVTTAEISLAREAYRPVAARGATLYFTIASLANVDSMYQYSLPAFSRLYLMRIEKAPKADALPERIAILVEDITRAFYTNVCRGLFEVHKLLFALLMAADIMRASGLVTPAEWSFFLLSGTLKEGREMPPAARPWLSQRQWLALLALEASGGAFAGLADDVARNAGGAWQAWLASKTAASDPLPGAPWSVVVGGAEASPGVAPTPGASISTLQRLLITRALREEKVVLASREFVRAQLGAFYTEPPPLDLEGTFGDSTAATPIIFVLSPGADPIDYLLKLAKAKAKASGMKVISLGQGQGPIAEAMMHAARTAGDWVCLQNCHLSVSWLPKLEAFLEQFTGTGEHPDYRLWLTSSPTAAFPTAVLQNGLKLTMEPPRGIKAQLRQVFLDLQAKDWEGSTKPGEYKQLLFSLAFYHAVALERRKFGPIGWNIAGIDFMASDFKTASMNLKLYLEEQPRVPWETLNAVGGDIVYGGRLTDRWDKRCNRSVLSRYLCPEVLGAPGSYAFDAGGVYHPPAPGATLEDVRRYVDALPLDELPDVYGLHENASISLQLKESGELLDTLVAMQPRAGGGSGGGPSSDDRLLALADDILARLPPAFDVDRAHAATFALGEGGGGGVNSLGVFLQQEIVRFDVLTSKMRSSLGTLKKAVKGVVVMSSALEAMAQALLFKRVPLEWEGVAYPSLKPLGGWVDDLLLRLRTLQAWLVDGPPHAFWISGFFFPQGFMTGALQMYARKTRIAIDTLEFKTHVQDMLSLREVPAPPENGVYVYGMFLVCARWDMAAKQLAEMEPGRLLYPLPIVWLEPVLAKDLVWGSDYPCPFYKTSRRAGTLSTTGHSTNFVTTLGLKTDKPGDHWIRRGTAVLSEDENA